MLRENVPGIGSKTIEKLLREFGSLDPVKQASEVDIAKSIGPVAAKKLLVYLTAESA